MATMRREIQMTIMGILNAYDKSAHEGGEVIENSRVVIKP